MSVGDVSDDEPTDEKCKCKYAKRVTINDVTNGLTMTTDVAIVSSWRTVSRISAVAWQVWALSMQTTKVECCRKDDIESIQGRVWKCNHRANTRRHKITEISMSALVSTECHLKLMATSKSSETIGNDLSDVNMDNDGLDFYQHTLSIHIVWIVDERDANWIFNSIFALKPSVPWK